MHLLGLKIHFITLLTATKTLSGNGGHLPLSDHVVVAECTDLVRLETPTHL